jgi:hypothetical protein
LSDFSVILLTLYFPQAFDQHLNMVLGEVEESVISREIDEETDEEIVRVCIPHFGECNSIDSLLFIRRPSEMWKCCSFEVMS